MSSASTTSSHTEPSAAPDLIEFLKFPLLPKEVRFMIWEYTWPEPRVIECEEGGYADSHFHHLDPMPARSWYEEVLCLRLAGHQSTVIASELDYLWLSREPVECHIPPPVALQINQESRAHTLEYFHIVESGAAAYYDDAPLHGFFFYSPQRDVIFFSDDVARDFDRYLPELERFHARELAAIETILVREKHWPPSDEDFDDEMESRLKYLPHLTGLKTVRLLWEDVAADYELDDGEEIETVPREFADRVRANFEEVCRRVNCTAEYVEFMDRQGRFY